PLPLPPHPAPFCGVVKPPTMEEEKSWVLLGPVPLVERSDRLLRCADACAVTWLVLLRSVGEVGEQREPQPLVRVREIVLLDPQRQVRRVIGVSQECGDDDERITAFANTLAEVQLRQHPRRDKATREVIGQADRDLARGQQYKQCREPREMS